MVNNVITQDQLKDLLHYNPEAGLFTWLVPKKRRSRVGMVAGYKNTGGYIRITINDKHYAHRLAWLYMTGSFPTSYQLTLMSIYDILVNKRHRWQLMTFSSIIRNTELNKR